MLRGAQQTATEPQGREVSRPAGSKPTTGKPTAVTSQQASQKAKVALADLWQFYQVLWSWNFYLQKDFHCNNNLFKHWPDHGPGQRLC